MPSFPQAASDGEVQTPPWQQPLGQVEESHTHAPDLHADPVPHTGFAPHRHVPSDAQVSAVVALQATHAAPLVPQVAVVFDWQVCAASQQPVAQLPALQVPPVHTPLVQVCPTAHAPPVPQRQVPVAEQLFAPPGHAAHAPPSGPQAVTDSAVQVFPVQQPVVHDVASQTQAPPTQRWPAAHAAPVPQVHAPAAEQPSVVSLLQTLQAWPAGPHVATVRAVQTPFRQQPEGHETGLQPHPPAPQAWPTAHWGFAPHRHSPAAEQALARVASQVVQAAPGAPQDAPLGGATHVFPVQHPFGQLVASQVHAFSTQRWPAAHMPLPAPHSHAPAVEHRSARAGSHAAHAAPAEPQLLRLREVHAAPAQQPPGQEVALQSQIPALQNWPAPHAGTQTAPPSLPPVPPPLPPVPPSLVVLPPSPPHRPLRTQSS